MEIASYMKVQEHHSLYKAIAIASYIANYIVKIVYITMYVF